MSNFVARVEAFALVLGAPGLFLITFLDSSFLSFPEATDLLLVLMVTQHKARMPLYALTAVVGSVVGCLALYFVGRKGGEALVRSRFSSGAVDRALGLIQRHGFLTLLIPCLLPPPAPFKIFVLLAGVAGISLTQFVLAIGIGRSLRYFGEGFLAVEYGDGALQFVEAHGKGIAFGIIGAILAGAAAYAVWVKVRRAPSR